MVTSFGAPHRALRRIAALVVTLLVPTLALAVQATPFSGPSIGSIPVEFLLFACVLAGVALFHQLTLPVALGGAV